MCIYMYIHRPMLSARMTKRNYECKRVQAMGVAPRPGWTRSDQTRPGRVIYMAGVWASGKCVKTPKPKYHWCPGFRKHAPNHWSPNMNGGLFWGWALWFCS